MAFEDFINPNKVAVRNKDGVLGTINKDKLEDAIRLGYKEVSREELSKEISVPSFESLNNPERVPVFNPNGVFGTIYRDKLDGALDSGYRKATQEEIAFAASLNAAKEAARGQDSTGQAALLAGLETGKTILASAAGATGAALGSSAGPAGTVAGGVGGFLATKAALDKGQQKLFDYFGVGETARQVEAEHPILVNAPALVAPSGGFAAAGKGTQLLSKALTKAPRVAGALEKTGEALLKRDEALNFMSKGVEKLTSSILNKAPGAQGKIGSAVVDLAARGTATGAENVVWGVSESLTDDQLNKDPDRFVESAVSDFGIGFGLALVPPALRGLGKSVKGVYSGGKRILGLEAGTMAREWGVSEKTIKRMSENIADYTKDSAGVEQVYFDAANFVQKAEDATADTVNLGFGKVRDIVKSTFLNKQATDEQRLALKTFADDLTKTAESARLQEAELSKGFINRLDTLKNNLNRQVASTGSMTSAELWDEIYAMKSELYATRAKFGRNLNPEQLAQANVYRELYDQVAKITEDSKLWGKELSEVISEENRYYSQLKRGEDEFKKVFTKKMPDETSRAVKEISPANMKSLLNKQRAEFVKAEGVRPQAWLENRIKNNQEMNDVVLKLAKKYNGGGVFDDVIAQAQANSNIVKESEQGVKKLMMWAGDYNSLKGFDTDAEKRGIQKFFAEKGLGLVGLGAAGGGYFSGNENLMSAGTVAAGVGLARGLKPATRLKLLNDITEAELKTSKILQSASKGVFASEIKAVAGELRAVPVSVLGKKLSGTPEQQVEAFKQDLQVARQQLQQQNYNKTGNPAFDAKLKEKTLGMIDLLEQQLPQTKKAGDFGSDEIKKISAEQEARFKSLVKVSNRPLEVLKDVAKGKVNRYELELLQQFYPVIYNRLQKEVMNEVNKQQLNGKELSPAIKNRVKALIGFGDKQPLLRTYQMLWDELNQPQQQRQPRNIPNSRNNLEQNLTSTERLNYK